MNAKTEIKASHGSIALALAAAQLEMEGAKKSSQNPHFRKMYADLASVMGACMPALNSHGIAVVQPTGEDNGERYVETILIHGETGEQLSCRVPLIVSKNDMQGYGSAVTYARRYGLMSMAGIAAEDDDGNDAAKAPPKKEARSEAKPNWEAISDNMIAAIRKNGVGVENDERFRADLARMLTNAPEMAARVNAELETKREASKPILEDEIPY